MKLRYKILIFVGGFTAIFYLMKSSECCNNRLFLNDLQGIPWLYSSVTMIFSIVAAFTIQKEWGSWNDLLDSVKSEVGTLNRLLLWSENFPEKIKDKFRDYIVKYLDTVIHEGLEKDTPNKNNDGDENNLLLLHSTLFEISEKKPELISTSFAIITDAIKHRENRIYHSTHQMPKAIKKRPYLFGSTYCIALSFNRSKQYLVRLHIHLKHRHPRLYYLSGYRRFRQSLAPGQLAYYNKKIPSTAGKN